MDINKDRIHDLVGVFYRNVYKTFYINSHDGREFIKPVGVFVSLGITTSLSTYNEIKDIINNNGYTAKIAEISSRRVSGQFLNSLTSVEDPKQYLIQDNCEENLLGESEARARLESLKEKITSEDIQLLKELVPKISTLEELIQKLTSNSGWESHMIKETESSFQIFHKYVNYKREGDVEYRIGIYVSENSN